MFDQTFVDTQAQTRKPWTVAASLVIQTILVAVAFLVPLMQVAVLHRPEAVPVWLPPREHKSAPQTEAKPVASQASANRPVFRVQPLQAPSTVPAQIRMTPDAPEIGAPVTGTTAGNLFLGLLPQTNVPPPLAPPAPVRQTQPSQSAPVRVSGGLQSAKLIFGPKPSYPPLAKATRTQGTVRIQAIIGRDGAIRDLQVLSGPPLLIPVAVEAVEKWRYQPTLLNNEAVEVITEIDVNFTIAQ